MKTLTILFLSVLSLSGFSQQVYATDDGAIRGYDPVAYFESGEPTKGSSEFAYEWSGATWYFSSQKNLDTFKNDPESYSPQYGGFCAYAVGNGYTYEADPNAWKIVEGKLYLNYSKGIQKKWSAKQDYFIEQADINWPKLIK